MKKQKKIPDYSKRIIICGGLVFDPITGKAHGNINKREIFFRQQAHDRILIEAFMRNQEQHFSYEELREVLDKTKKPKKRSKNDNKFVNDKVDALKKKLKKLGFERKDLRAMFLCDRGYRLTPPRTGKKFLPKPD